MVGLWEVNEALKYFFRIQINCGNEGFNFAIHCLSNHNFFSN